MPKVFDDIELSLLPALQETLRLATRADFCVGYFNLRGWRQLDDGIERFAGGEGGSLIVSVDNRGNIVGIADGIASADPGKRNHDGYELYFRNAMASAIGADCTLFYNITVHKIEGQEVCRIAVKPSPKPVYVNGDFYVCDGNGKKKLNSQQTQEYIKQRWLS